MKKRYTHFLTTLLASFLGLLSPAIVSAQCNSPCGTGLDGAFHATSNTTLAGGVHNFSSFIIDAGVTVQVTGTTPLTVYSTGIVSIQGTLTVKGGNGGDGVTFSALGIAGIGVAGGGDGGIGTFHPSNGQLVGGAGQGSGGGGSGMGWSGGGGAGYSAVGATAGPNGGNGGPMYGNVQISPLVAGSGGGGGSGGNNCGSGGGGAGGGLMYISTCDSLIILSGGNLNANGGNGGSDGTGNCGSGGGGSGGSIWLAAQAFVNNGTITAVGGTGGASTIGGSPYYGVGGTGANGRIRLDAASMTGTGTITPAVGYMAPGLFITLSGNDVNCFGQSSGTVSVNATGGTPNYSYLWNTGQTSASVSNLPAGTYTVVVTDSVGCSQTDSVTINQPASAVTPNATTSSVLCTGGSDGAIGTMATGGTGGFTYMWSTGDTVSAISNLPAGSYTLTLTDANGCSDTSIVVVSEPASLPFSMLSVTDISCTDANDGSISAMGTGGTPGYTYLWSNGQTGNQITGLASGSYSVVITDTNGCTGSDTATVTNPTAIAVSLTAAPSTGGGANGAAMATASGGTAPYTYAWNTTPVQTTATATGLTSGTYEVCVTDVNGCSICDSVFVDDIVGIGNPYPAAAFTLFPNPTNGLLNIQALNIPAGNWNWTIMDAKGAVVRSASQATMSAPSTWQVSLSDLSRGIYMFHANGEKWQFIQKIVLE